MPASTITQTRSKAIFPILALACAVIGSGQPSQPPNAEALRGLNNRILQLHAALQEADSNGNAGQAASIRSQAAPVFAQRNALLEALIRDNPKAALGLAFAADLRADLASKFSASSSALEQHGEWQGKSDHLIFDDPQRQSRRFEVRLRNGQENIELYSANGEPHCVSGNIVTAKGIRVNNVVAADGLTYTSGAVAAAGCSTQGAQNSIVILVDFPGVPLPTNITPSSVSNIFFGTTGRTVNNFWREASYGKASATGNVVGPFTLNRVYTCDEYSAMRTAAIAAADAAVHFPSYTRVFIIFPNPGSCSWAGLGSLGCGTLSSADGTFQASTSWLLATHMGDTNNGVKLATHEGGHNLALHHASSRGFSGEPLGPVGAAGTLSEYGDPLSTMGSWNFGHYAVPHKAAMGWLSGSQVLTAETPGSFTVFPVETPTAGVQALKVRRGTGNDAWLWVEFRQPTGLFHNSWSASAQPFAGALVHYQDSTTGTRTHLLDFTPGSSGGFSDPALTGTWVDPYSNVSLSVTGVGSSGLSLNVNYGALPCSRVAPSLSLTPPNPSVVSGSSTAYTVSIRNNDTAGCSASAFSFSSALPSGWTTTFSPAVLTVNPGQTLTATMTKAVPAAVTPGTYGVDVSASDGNHAPVSANANITVTAPAEPIGVTLTANPTAVSARSYVTLTATVKKQTSGTAVAGASVRFSITRSGAGTSNVTAATNASGVASISYKAQQRGTYSVTATATSGSQTANSNTASFTAN